MGGMLKVASSLAVTQLAPLMPEIQPHVARGAFSSNSYKSLTSNYALKVKNSILRKFQ